MNIIEHDRSDQTMRMRHLHLTFNVSNCIPPISLHLTYF